MAKFTESEVEEVLLDILKDLGYGVLNGPDIAPAPDGIRPERNRYSDVVLEGRLRSGIQQVNPKASPEVVEAAVKKVIATESQKLIVNNHRFHNLLVNGVDIECRKKDGSTGWEKVWLIDFKDPENNDWTAVNQFTIIEGQNNRRPDVIIFVNGLPLAVVELKNAADANATIWSAFNQFQTYKVQIPSLFNYNAALVVSDGQSARYGTITSNREWFLPWKTLDGKKLASKTVPQMDVLFKGMFKKQTFLDLVRNFIVYEVDRKETLKKLAAYHQYYAVNKAVEATLKATGPRGDKRCGVVWHTQGSGKSLSMVFYTGKLISAMDNPTIVVLTDRNDLDDQLYGTFSRCHELLRQTPQQADSRAKLRELLRVASGGVVFTTIQKFLPETKGDTLPMLSDRRNIVVIADEAHRSQYDFIDGYARHMRDALPNASFIGYTGTPIEKADRSTPVVFGDYIDVYDIHQAVEDGATVRIYYESRLAKLELKKDETPKVDAEFEEVTEGEEIERKERLKSKWARLEAVVGTEKRIKLIAEDIVDHFEKRSQAMDGKGMIVAMSRRICVDLYNEIVRLRPDWHNPDDDKGFVKIVMTGSASDPVEWQQHIRNKLKREKMADRMKNPQDPLKLVIVRDMWLTGFDVPALHTMYIDKPMRGHGLMQTIARVNRVFKDKQGGLIVDYLGIAESLKKALAEYSDSDRKDAGIPQEEAVAIMLEKYEVVQAFFHGFDYTRYLKGTAKDRHSLLPNAMTHIIEQEDGKKRYLQAVTELSKAFSLSVPHEKAIEIRDEVGFFQAVRSVIAKALESSTDKDPGEVDSAIRQIISKAIVPEGIVDIYAAAGIKTPDVSILSDEFLAEIKGIPYKNLAMELLKKLLNDEIKVRSKKNLVQSRAFSEMLEKILRLYQNRSIETAEVITHLIELAKKMKEEVKKGKDLNLNDAELAFYDALETNDSAVKVLGDEVLRKIAIELAETLRANATIDWTLRESAQAKLRLLVKKILKKYSYPPDKQEKATKTVLEQAELICGNIVST